MKEDEDSLIGWYSEWTRTRATVIGCACCGITIVASYTTLTSFTFGVVTTILS